MLNRLSKTVLNKQKRIGRGYGSGKGGHTSSRGAKGQKARGKVSAIFEGTKIKKSLLKRLPLLRGKGKFNSLGSKVLTVKVEKLNLFTKDSEITLKTLAEKGLIKSHKNQSLKIKIIGADQVKVPLKVKLPCSKEAAKQIESAGGKIEIA